MKENPQIKQNAPLHVVERCLWCNRKFSVSEFRAAADFEEFIISGLCQECQDETLKEGK